MDSAAGFDERFLFQNFDDNDTPDDDETVQSSHGRKILKARRSLNESHDRAAESAQLEDNQDDPEQRYIAELELQNAKLKSVIKRMVGPQATKFHPDSQNGNSLTINLLEQLEEEIQSKPFAVVLFLNNDISIVHRREIHEFMQTLSEKKAAQEVLLTKKYKSQNSSVPLKSFVANPMGKRSNIVKVKDSEEYHVISSCQYYKSFFLDRMGCPLLEDNPSITDLWDIPVYQQIYLKALPLVEETQNVRVRQIRQCFNCGGEHHLADCKEPRDANRINEARQQHAAHSRSPAGYDSRYHVTDDENSERFRHFKPGQISPALEEALGISLQTHLPPYIYKMRLLGYPLAWLKPAEDGLKMYGAEGNVMDDPDVEEGEIKPIKMPSVISYPGFNAPLPEGVEDRAIFHGMLPFQPERADLDIAMKRAQILGYPPTEAVAKRLRFDDDGIADMDVEEESAHYDASLPPPLPLIETADQFHKPPPPSESDASGLEGDMHGDPSKEEGEIAEDAVSTRVAVRDAKQRKAKGKSTKIDETTYRNWYVHDPLTSIGITYVMYTQPPTSVQRLEISLQDIPKSIISELDREPWKTQCVSWYDPLYGDLAAPTGTFDAIRGLLKQSKRRKRKAMT